MRYMVTTITPIIQIKYCSINDLWRYK